MNKQFLAEALFSVSLVLQRWNGWFVVPVEPSGHTSPRTHSLGSYLKHTSGSRVTQRKVVLSPEGNSKMNLKGHNVVFVTFF